MTTQNERAAPSRMNAALAGILTSLRQEARAPEMMRTGLGEAMAALGAEGVAVIRGLPDSAAAEPEVLHCAGMIGLPATSAGALLALAMIGLPVLSVERNGRPIVVALCRESSSERLGIALWRRCGARAWSGDELPLVDGIAGIVW